MFRLSPGRGATLLLDHWTAKGQKGGIILERNPFHLRRKSDCSWTASSSSHFSALTESVRGSVDIQIGQTGREGAAARRGAERRQEPSLRSFLCSSVHRTGLTPSLSGSTPSVAVSVRGESLYVFALFSVFFLYHVRVSMAVHFTAQVTLDVTS